MGEKRDYQFKSSVLINSDVVCCLGLEAYETSVGCQCSDF